MTSEDILKDWDSLKLAVKHSIVEKFVSGSERPCDNNDFLETKKKRENLTTKIKAFLENYANDNFLHKTGEKTKTSQDINIDNKLLVMFLIMCGQNAVVQPWNTVVTVQNCEIILSQILKLFNFRNVTELIARNNKINLIKDVLKLLCGDLTATEWKLFPASVACYKWILEMLKQPDLSEHLHFLLPPALLLTDDYVKENRMTGVMCLNHIINNLTIAELQLYGHGDVIYNALIHILRIREADLINCTILTLLSVVTKVEFNLGDRDVTKWSKFDDVLEIYLENMELEQLTDLRHCYISNLHLLINAVGCGIVRWSKRLLRVFDEFVQVAGENDDDKTMNYCVKAIDKFIQYSLKATSLHGKHLFFTLLIALHFTNNSNSEVKRETQAITIGCLKSILGELSENARQEIKKELEQAFSVNINFQKSCEEIMNFFETINC